MKNKPRHSTRPTDPGTCDECRPTRLPAAKGLPVMISLREGRFPLGTYHPVCSDCPSSVPRFLKRKRRAATLRDKERNRRVVVKLHA